MAEIKLTHRDQSLINYSDGIEDAKVTANELYGGYNIKSADALFFEDSLENIENGIRQLNEFSQKSWLISAIVLYSMIFNNNMYLKSGLEWNDYLKESKTRLGMDSRDVSEALSSARFFIQHHKKLKNAGWSPIGASRKLARAELAYMLSNDIDATVKHLSEDTWSDFKEWYTSLKEVPLVPAPIPNETIGKKDIVIEKNVIKVDGKIAVTISDDIPEEDKAKYSTYISKIFDALKSGYEPAIIPVYDNREANVLVRLRDNNRKNK